MAEAYLSDLLCSSNSSQSSPQRSPIDLRVDSPPDRERLRLILIGTADGVREMIHRLHQANIAEAGSWSRLLPVPNSTEVMSILMLSRRR